MEERFEEELGEEFGVVLLEPPPPPPHEEAIAIKVAKPIVLYMLFTLFFFDVLSKLGYLLALGA